MTLRQREAILDIGLNGELDVASSGEFCRVVRDVIADGAHHVLVDCRRLDFVDSTRIGALLDLRKQLEDLGGTMILFGPKRAFATTLAVTRLDGVFHIVEAPTD